MAMPKEKKKRPAPTRKFYFEFFNNLFILNSFLSITINNIDVTISELFHFLYIKKIKNNF
jgi:hypothetical protein